VSSRIGPVEHAFAALMEPVQAAPAFKSEPRAKASNSSTLSNTDRAANKQLALVEASQDEYSHVAAENAVEEIDLEFKMEVSHHSEVMSDAEQQAHKGKTHAWRVQIAFPDKSGQFEKLIRRVVFVLHPTFKPQKRLVKRPPFVLCEHGWGSFVLEIDIYFANKTKQRFPYDLILNGVEEPPLDSSKLIDVRLAQVPKNYKEFGPPVEHVGSNFTLSTAKKSKMKEHINHSVPKKSIDRSLVCSSTENNQCKSPLATSQSNKSPEQPKIIPKVGKSPKPKKTDQTKNINSLFGTSIEKKSSKKASTNNPNSSLPSDSLIHSEQPRQNDSDVAQNSAHCPTSDENSISSPSVTDHKQMSKKSQSKDHSPNVTGSSSTLTKVSDKESTNSKNTLKASFLSNSTYLLKDSYSNASELLNFDLLAAMQARIMALDDPELLVQIVNCVQASGKLTVGAHDYDFDLCDLDSRTLFKIKSLLEI